MKKTALIVALSLAGVYGLAQTCNEIVEICKKQLSADTDDLYISDGQVYRAFLNIGETAEFEATLYGGSIYRLSTSAGDDDNHVVLTVRDQENNILFSNLDHKKAPFWDFKVENTINCTVALELDKNTKDSGSGCANLLIAFKK